jgi:hypothetical protein
MHIHFSRVEGAGATGMKEVVPAAACARALLEELEPSVAAETSRDGCLSVASAA